MSTVVSAVILLFVLVIVIVIAITFTILAIFNMAAACVAGDDDVSDLLEAEQPEGEAEGEELLRSHLLQSQNGPEQTAGEGEDPHFAVPT